jgi:chemotaxis protein methyltransferase CheR
MVVRELERITDEQFNIIRTLMNKQVGIVLQDQKKALVEARMNRRLRTLGIESYGDYLAFLNKDRSGKELILLIDAISTNVTHFFREKDHFDFIRGKTAQWIAAGRTRLRFWSAACSSGEEPYSLAMTLRSVPGADEADIRILASDISTHMLRNAVQGTYQESAVETIPDDLVRRFVEKRQSAEGVVYRVADSLKNMIVFRRLNLNKTPYAIQGIFDVVMCRNVMIYFDAELRSRIVGEAYRLLRPGGYLMIGHAETLAGESEKFQFEKPAVYRRL